MQFKRMSIFVVAISLFWLAGRGASALLVAKAIAPPGLPFLTCSVSPYGLPIEWPLRIETCWRTFG